jgi:cytochrome c553
MMDRTFALLLAAALTGRPGPAENLTAAATSTAPISARIEADWLRQVPLRLLPLAGERQMRPELDAAGGVDGVINGEWGFHTQLEEQPWWQVDLGEVVALDRLAAFNRCTGGFEARAARMIVSLSEDGKSFSQAYQHDGTVFRGHPDGQPLVVPLKGAKARFVRLQLPGRDYFHLDEVQVFAAGTGKNIALGKPATQSSVSQWSVAHDAASDWEKVLRVTIEGGLRLVAALEAKGVAVDEARALLEHLRTSAAPLDEAEGRERYLRARRAIRALALANPLLDFDSLVFVKRAPGMFPHLSDQNYGWWSRPGGGVFVLKGLKSGAPEVVPVTGTFAPGSFLQPELSFDGKRVLFAYCKHFPEVAGLQDKMTKANLPEESFYHLYETDLATGATRQLTRGRYDDFDGRYLPDGDIAFLSTRKGTFIQVTAANAMKTLAADLPDSYVRCGGDRGRPVPVYTLHAMDPDGGNLRPLSAHETFEYTPSLANDGRILYCRWDYVDRFNGHFFGLWSSGQDGANGQLVYGNYTVRPQATMEPRAIPGSDRIVFTASAHHSITGGSLALLDRRHGDEGEAPLTRLTPEVPFPETEKNVDSYYANPWPLSEEFFLVSWSDRRLPPHHRSDSPEDNPVNASGLYLYDRFGNLELLYRDPEISSMNPVPLKPRPVPPALPAVARHDGAQAGAFFLQDVYDGLEGVARGTVKRLRVVALLPKVQPEMNCPPVGISREDTGKYVLGTVPVEADGSAHFRAPSGISFFFQALDEKGRSVQTMRSATYLQPGQTLSCVGCHEPRLRGPHVLPPRIAGRSPPVGIEPDVEGTLPLRFDRLVQPVLDAHCVSCHGPDGKDEKARAYDLTAEKSYEALLGYARNDLRNLVFERDYSRVNDGPALNSRIVKLLGEDPVHRDLSLADTDWRRLFAWMDTYGATNGAFSDAQELELSAWFKTNAPLFMKAAGE